MSRVTVLRLLVTRLELHLLNRLHKSNIHLHVMTYWFRCPVSQHEESQTRLQLAALVADVVV